MKRLLKSIFIYVSSSPFSPILGLVRSILALSLLLTLVFNSTSTLFKPVSGRKDIIDCSGDNHLTIFCILNPNNYDSLIMMKFVAIILLIIIMIGYFPQVLGIIHFYIAYSVQHTMSIVDGGEQVTLMMTFWLMLISLFDNRLNHWEQPKQKLDFNKAVGWAFILTLKIQISYLYLNSAVTKMKNKEWLDGTAVYYYLNDNIYGLPSLFYNFFKFILETSMIGFVTWGTLILQLVISASIFASRRVKQIVFYFALLMHEIFALFIGLISFSIVMLAVLIFYYKLINRYELEENK